MYYTNWIPRPRFAVMYGLDHATSDAARNEAKQTLRDHSEVSKVEITDGTIRVYETITREP
jgi:hypothetical protein